MKHQNKKILQDRIKEKQLKRDRIANDLLMAFTVSIASIIGLLLTMNGYRTIPMQMKWVVLSIGVVFLVLFGLFIYKTVSKQVKLKVPYMAFVSLFGVLSCGLIYFMTITAIHYLLYVIGAYLVFSMGFAVFKMSKV